MYVVFLIYCSFLSYCLQLVSYPYFITDCLLSLVRLSFFFSLFRLVLVWYWHWWQGLWKLYGIKDFNIIQTFYKRKKSLYRDIYCYHDIKFVISWYKILVISPTPTHSYSKATHTHTHTNLYSASTQLSLHNMFDHARFPKWLNYYREEESHVVCGPFGMITSWANGDQV